MGYLHFLTVKLRLKGFTWSRLYSLEVIVSGLSALESFSGAGGGIGNVIKGLVADYRLLRTQLVSINGHWYHSCIVMWFFSSSVR